jgi:protease-4
MGEHPQDQDRPQDANDDGKGFRPPASQDGPRPDFDRPEPARSYGINWRLVGAAARNIFAIIGGAFLLMYVLLLLAIMIAGGAPSVEGFEREVVRTGAGDRHLVEINISGMIGAEGGLLFPGGPDSETVLQLRAVRKDPYAAGVLLRINSPGGGITASDVIYNEIQKVQESGRPVVALFEDLAASGGYYVAAPCDQIIAHPTSLTGSIGVLIVSYEISGLLEKLGINDQTITAGENKDMLSFSKPLEPDQRELVEEIVEEMHERFLTIVSKGREIPMEQLRPIADGRILLAQQALEAGLVDRLGYWEDAVDALAEKADVQDAGVVRYRRPGGFLSALTAGGPQQIEKRVAESVAARLHEQAIPRALYLWQGGDQ